MFLCLQLSFHDFFNGHAEPTLGAKSASQNRAGNGHLVFAGNRCLDREAKDLALCIENAATILPIQSAADAGTQAWGTALATAFTV